ncbi:hypothetical protein Bca4012_008923 [Brassica carinata]
MCLSPRQPHSKLLSQNEELSPVKLLLLRNTNLPSTAADVTDSSAKLLLLVSSSFPTMAFLVAESSAPPSLAPEPPDPDLHVVCPVDPPEPPVPPDPPPCLLVFLKQPFNLSKMVSLFCFLLRWKLCLSPRLSLRGCDFLTVSTSDTFFAYGLHSPVVYRFLCEYFGCVDWSSISSCFDLPTTPLYKVLHAHLSSLFSTYSAIEWFKELFGCVKLELRFMILACDIPMGLVSFGYTFATSSNIYITLTRSSAVEEKLIVIFIPMSMDLADYDFPLVPRLNQYSFLIFLPIWNELDEQASLVLQGSSSHRMLFSAYVSTDEKPFRKQSMFTPVIYVSGEARACTE